ncbi:hypothetical protein A0H81_01695 [Grifola frondosa]|uniref:Uncharacterized protein n=1 Tax=Grifola frondosa TaxID=5627 RepID=A0A1C7MLE5_GRIFR|nr:hypothetical protein A0H81_01695 [Grifola frondosa]
MSCCTEAFRISSIAFWTDSPRPAGPQTPTNTPFRPLAHSGMIVVAAQLAKSISLVEICGRPGESVMPAEYRDSDRGVCRSALE